MRNQSIEELKKRIEDLEDSIFYINMIDRWTREDSELYDKYSKELRELKSLLIEEIANN